MAKNWCTNCGRKIKANETVAKCEKCGGECVVLENPLEDLMTILIIIFMFTLFGLTLANAPGGINNPIPPHTAHWP